MEVNIAWLPIETEQIVVGGDDVCLPISSQTKEQNKQWKHNEGNIQTSPDEKTNCQVKQQITISH